MPGNYILKEFPNVLSLISGPFAPDRIRKQQIFLDFAALRPIFD